MKDFLQQELMKRDNYPSDWTSWVYQEDKNIDALSDDWLDNGTSYIYKVGVLCAIDSNKCDWVDVIIGTQRTDTSHPKVKGVFTFEKGENDDIGRTIQRAVSLMQMIHPVFEI